MMEKKHDEQNLQGSRLTAYRAVDPCPMLAPVPVALVTCCDPEDKAHPNVLTVAWTGVVNSKPPMLSVSIRPDRYSHGLIAKSGEFAVNLCDVSQAKALDLCGVISGRDGDKFAAAGLKTAPAPELHGAPAILGCPVMMSCAVREQKTLGCHDLFIGEILAVRVREDLFDGDGSMHLERAHLICYSHGLYQEAGDVLGFFGWSLAKPDVLERRMKPYRKQD